MCLHLRKLFYHPLDREVAEERGFRIGDQGAQFGMVGEGIGHIGHGCVPLWRQVLGDIRPRDCKGCGRILLTRVRTPLERAVLMPARPVRYADVELQTKYD